MIHIETHEAKKLIAFRIRYPAPEILGRNSIYSSIPGEIICILLINYLLSMQYFAIAIATMLKSERHFAAIRRRPAECCYVNEHFLNSLFGGCGGNLVLIEIVQFKASWNIYSSRLPNWAVAKLHCGGRSSQLIYRFGVLAMEQVHVVFWANVCLLLWDLCTSLSSGPYPSGATLMVQSEHIHFEWSMTGIIVWRLYLNRS